MPTAATLRARLHHAESLERSGHLAAAEAAYREVLGRQASLPNTWYNLARLQRRLGRYEDALASYQQALAHGVQEPEEVHLNRGVILADDLRRPAAAEAAIQQALACNPRFVPALLNLGNLQADLGRKDDARRTYEHALAIDPRCWSALARHADLAPIAGPRDPVIARLEQALGTGATADGDRATLGFALGRALDACGEYARAFEAYAAANRSSRAAMPPGWPGYDRGRQEAFVDELIGTFTRDWFCTHGSDSRAEPIFICGMFRSGSTLAEQVLAAHPRVTSGGELDTLLRLVRSELAPFPSAAARADRARFDAIGTRYLQELARRFPEADRVTDKRPDNFLLLGVVKALFPRARIVHTTRDALDNCLSVYFLHLDPRLAYAMDLMDIGHYYVQYRRLMTHWQAVFGDSLLDFHYDDFVREPRPAVERLLDYCGLEWNERCLAFHEAATAVKTASVWQVREPLYRRSSGRARNYASELAGLRDYLGAAGLA